MGEEAHAEVNVAAPKAPLTPQKTPRASSDSDKVHFDDSPPSPVRGTHPWSRKNTSLDVDDYFVGPRDTSKHSKWPIFMQMHGSILPEMILPLIFVAGWSTAITCISTFVFNLGINSLLLTVLGFVVGLGLSFRSSTAYERYNEGRKFWTQLMTASHALARVIWIHTAEREEQRKEDLLAKMTGLNLIVAFAVALKHRLRFEPYTGYDDLEGLVQHLETFAQSATEPGSCDPPRKSSVKAIGEYLGVSFAESNPRKVIKRSKKPLGNLPLEILSYLASYMDEVVENGQLKTPMHLTLAYNNIAALNDVLTGTDRILNTPLPVAYSISIAQVTWVYILSLPFQLYKALGWVTIPGSVIAAYIILGILLIGREIENPFGNDVNDLPLDHFCQQIAVEIDIIAARRRPRAAAYIRHPANRVLFPLSQSAYPVWAQRSETRIRAELVAKTEMGFEQRMSMQAERAASPPEKGGV